MCDELDPCKVWESERRRARKEHRCDACDESIQPGHLYQHTFWVFDGEAGSYKHCRRCWTIYKALGPEANPLLDCGTVWNDPPPEIEALAFALPSDIYEIAGQTEVDDLDFPGVTDQSPRLPLERGDRR
jgi:hypothetical protein